MKFVIAAGILLPALSRTVRSEEDKTKLSSSSSSHHDGWLTQARHNDDSPFDVSDFLASVVKKNRPVTSPRANDSRQRRRALGLLKNKNKTKKCDPSSKDPDIGILSCDIGYECVMVDQQLSSLGGICTLLTTTPTATTRHLQDEELVTCSLCNLGAQISTEDYNTVLNAPNEEGNGATCGEVAYAVYYNTTVGIPYSSCLFVAELAQESGCCTPAPVTGPYNCNICGDVGLFYPENVFPLIDGSILPCADIPLDLNETECERDSSYYATHCCAPEFDASRVPTAAPQEGGSDATPTTNNNPPSSDMVTDAAPPRSTTLVLGSILTTTLLSTVALLLHFRGE